MNHSLFASKIENGQPMKPFMVAGILEKEYEGEHTQDAYAIDTNKMLQQVGR